MPCAILTQSHTPSQARPISKRCCSKHRPCIPPAHLIGGRAVWVGVASQPGEGGAEALQQPQVQLGAQRPQLQAQLRPGGVALR